jgi:hypothetical protein
MAKASKQTITKEPVFTLIEAHRNAIAAEAALDSEWHAITSTWTWGARGVVGGRDVPDEHLDRLPAGWS